MVVRRIRNRTKIAMLCMDPVLFFMNQWDYLSDLSSPTVQFPTPPAACAACPWSLSNTSTVYYLLSLCSLTLRYLHLILISFLFSDSYSYCYPLDPANHEDTHGWDKKKHTSSRGLSLPLSLYLSRESAPPSLRPSIHPSVLPSFLKDFFLPFHSLS